VLINYHVLASHHVAVGNLRYNLTIKFHYMQHLADFCTVNPYFVSCYCEESFIAQGARSSNVAVGRHEVFHKWRGPFVN
jgi:hypothetical protein